jgi:hypothetical protein
MTLQENKALVERFIDEILNKGNTAAIADFCVPGSIFAGGLAGQIQAMKLSFPDNYLTIEDIVAEGDQRGRPRHHHTGQTVGRWSACRRLGASRTRCRRPGKQSWLMPCIYSPLPTAGSEVTRPS